MHTWPEGTADALIPMIGGMRDLGATFVTVDRLETIP
jgi:hypothetical protein